MAERFAPPVFRSLRVKLPLLTSAIIVAVLATFIAAAYREIRATLLRSASERAEGAAAQLAVLLAQSAHQRAAEVERAAASPAVREFVERPGPGRRPAAEHVLAALESPADPTGGAPAIELWSPTGERLLAVPDSPTAQRPPAREGTRILPLQVDGGVPFTDFAVDVPTDEPTSAPAAILRVRRPIAAGATRDVLAKMVGSRAILLLGNRDGSVWTDLSSVVAAPPIDLSSAGVSSYRDRTGARSLAAVAPIAGTPWSAVVAFPEGGLLAPARAWTRRMIAFGLAVAAVSGLIIMLLSARITTPLRELTEASEALAAGRDRPLGAGSARHDEIGRLSTAFGAMARQIRDAHHELERRVQQRTAGLEQAHARLEERAAELAAVNQELEAFSYSVSHDLRAPLRHISGFAALLEQSAGPSLDPQGRRYLSVMVDASARMGRLIDDLLAFSRVGRAAITKRRIGLAELVDDARREVVAGATGREIAWTIHPLPEIDADPAMFRLVLVNLLSNAVKYTRPRARAEIEIGVDAPRRERETVIFVRDNGVGFDPEYAHKLFGVFQRLHRAEEFDGTGIGLANVRRVVLRHGGDVWAESAVDRGATFYVSIPADAGRGEHDGTPNDSDRRG